MEPAEQSEAIEHGSRAVENGRSFSAHRHSLSELDDPGFEIGGQAIDIAKHVDPRRQVERSAEIIVETKTSPTMKRLPPFTQVVPKGPRLSARTRKFSIRGWTSGLLWGDQYAHVRTAPTSSSIAAITIRPERGGFLTKLASHVLFRA
jgi:hypothetical protein